MTTSEYLLKDYTLSVCIPERPYETIELLNSIEKQSIKPLEVIICEDKSSDRKIISREISNFKKKSKLNIKYIENKENYGYDKNLRKTIGLARGKFIILSGNDDLFTENAFEIIVKKLQLYDPIMLIRSYLSFYKDLKAPKNPHRYVNKDLIVDFSPVEAAWLFYRTVLVSGLVFKTSEAQKISSNVVDGTLYYQNYLLTKLFKNIS